MTERPGAALRRAVRVRWRVRVRVRVHGDAGARWRGAGYARGRGGPSGGPGRAPTLARNPGERRRAALARGVPVVHHPWRCTTGRERGRAGVARRDYEAAPQGPPTRTGAGPGPDRVGRSGGAPARRRQARPRAGQRPGHAPGSIQRPVVWSRGARSAFADMSRSVSVAPAGVNPRPWPPNALPTCPHIHPAHRLRPALSPTPRPVSGPTSAAENRGRNSWPRNAAATLSPGSAPAHRPRGPGRAGHDPKETAWAATCGASCACGASASAAAGTDPRPPGHDRGLGRRRGPAGVHARRPVPYRGSARTPIARLADQPEPDATGPRQAPDPSGA